MKGIFYSLWRQTAVVCSRHVSVLLFALILLISFDVHAKTVVIGTGSGQLNQTSMTGLNAGDVLAVQPGTYSGGNFTNLTGITVINNGGLVTFTGQINLNNDNGLTFSGTGASGISNGFFMSGNSVFMTNGICRHLYFYNFNCYNDHMFLNASENGVTQIYNGDSASILIRYMTIANIVFKNSGYVIFGSQSPAYALHNVMDSVAIYNVVADSTTDAGQLVRTSNIYRFDIHNNVMHFYPIYLQGDIAIFGIYGGSGQIHNNYRYGGWGQLSRFHCASLAINGTADCWAYNNIDLGSVCYPSFEIKTDPTDWGASGGLLTGANIHVINNTAGDKLDYWKTYLSNVCVLSVLAGGYTAEIKNNVTFNCQSQGESDGIRTWVGTNPAVSRTNNVYYASATAAGITDSINCFLNSNSALIDAGITVPYVNTDFAGISRPQGNAYDIGAREYNKNTPPPVNKPPVAITNPQITITLPVNTATIDGSKSMDSDGVVVSYAWTEISGPGVTIPNASAATNTLSNLVQGTYIFKLTVTDNGGATGTANDTVVVNGAVKPPLVANAGADQTITLPTNSTTLNGSASTGSIASYAWSQIAGPSSAVIANPAAVSTVINNLVKGTYTFTLSLVDSSNAKAVDTINIIVNPAPNKPPVANAGNGQSITLPIDSVTLNGSASYDPDGTIASYSWTELSGPDTATLVTATAATTSATNLIAGQYIFQLLVTDNQGATSTALVKINVLAVGNIMPVANAGGNQTITLPTNTVSLNGKGSSGTIASYAWAQKSGPSVAGISTPAASTTTLTGLIKGVYVIYLTVSDASGNNSRDSLTVTVNPAPNIPPVANAGSSKNITLPTNSVTLDGSGSYDPDGTIVTYAWTQISGPSSASITNAGNVAATAGSLKVGSYTFQLTVTDNSGASTSAQVKINVSPAPNQPPIANAGQDISITLPTNSATLNGTLSYDPDGSIASYTWNKISGTGSITITNSNTATPTVLDLAQGVYVFQLTVTDNDGASSSDQVTITVNPPANQPPVSNAGNEQTITLPTNSVTLNGSNSFDPDGTIVSYTWVQLDGPTNVTISNASNAIASATGLVQGQYDFWLLVKDNDGATGSDKVTIIVNAATSPTSPVPPVANAGNDTTIALPSNSLTLDGINSSSVSSAITSYTWTEISGPNNATITSPDEVESAINNLIVGEYIFKLSVTDADGLTDTATVTVKVVNEFKTTQQVSLYPNPAHDIVNVHLISDAVGTVRINVFDMNGRLVQSIQTDKEQSLLSTTVNVSGLASGIYVLQSIIGTSTAMVTKFIKQ